MLKLVSDENFEAERKRQEIARLAAEAAKRVAADKAAREAAKKASEKALAYEVLKKVKRGDGKLIIDLLVSEMASRQEVMKLADSIAREHAGKYAMIAIFDSRETWRRQLDESYPEKEDRRHCLVVIDGEFGRGIEWVAQGRGEKK